MEQLVVARLDDGRELARAHCEDLDTDPDLFQPRLDEGRGLDRVLVGRPRVVAEDDVLARLRIVHHPVAVGVRVPGSREVGLGLVQVEVQCLVRRGIPVAGRGAGLHGRVGHSRVAAVHLVNERLLVDGFGHCPPEGRIRCRVDPVPVRDESARLVRLDGDARLLERQHGLDVRLGLQRVQDVCGVEEAEVDLAPVEGGGHLVLVVEDLLDDDVDMGFQPDLCSPEVGVPLQANEVPRLLLRDHPWAASDCRDVLELLGLVDRAPDVLGEDELVHPHGLPIEHRGRLVRVDDERRVVGGLGGLEDRQIRGVIADVAFLVEVQRPRDVVRGEWLPVRPLQSRPHVVGERHVVRARFHAGHDGMLEVGAEVLGGELDRQVVLE